MLIKIINGLKRIPKTQTAQIAVHMSSSSLRLVELTKATMSYRGSTDYTGENWQQPLRTMLAEVAANSRLHIVLSPDFYQLVQLDKPAVSDSEMLQALPWQVKDLVSITPEDIVADYIDLPGNAAQPAKINVVVARLGWLKQLVTEVEQAGQTIVSIQPEEWLAAQLVEPAAHATMLVIHQPEQEVLIQIVRDGMLYFSRRTRGFTGLHLSSAAELRDGLLDRLQLELQRSMDYFESQLKQPPVRDIQLLMTQSALIGELLHNSGFTRVDALAPRTTAANFSVEQLLNCWPAVAVLNQCAMEPGK